MTQLTTFPIETREAGTAATADVGAEATQLPTNTIVQGYITEHSQSLAANKINEIVSPNIVDIDFLTGDSLPGLIHGAVSKATLAIGVLLEGNGHHSPSVFWRFPRSLFGTHFSGGFSLSLLNVGTSGTVRFDQKNSSFATLESNIIVTGTPLAGAITSRKDFKLSNIEIHSECEFIDLRVILSDSVNSSRQGVVSHMWLTDGNQNSFLNPDVITPRLSALEIANQASLAEGLAKIVNPNRFSVDQLLGKDLPAMIGSVATKYENTEYNEYGVHLSSNGTNSIDGLWRINRNEFGTHFSGGFSFFSANVGTSGTVRFDQRNAVTNTIVSSSVMATGSALAPAITEHTEFSVQGVEILPDCDFIELRILMNDGNTQNRQVKIGFLWLVEGLEGRYIEPSSVAGIDEVYVSNAGSDQSAGSLNAPLKTLAKAINAIKGKGVLHILGPEYTIAPNDRIDANSIKGDITFIGNNTSGSLTIIKCSSPLTGISKTTGRSKIYQTNDSGLVNSPNWVYQDGVNDPETMVQDDELRPEHNGRTHRLYCSKIRKTVSNNLSDALAEIDTSMYPRCFFDESTNILYFSLVAGAAPSNNIYVDGDGLISSGLDFMKHGKLEVYNLDIRYGGLNTKAFKRAHLGTVKILGAKSNAWEYSGNSSFTMLETSCAGSQEALFGDGVNGHQLSELTGMGLYTHDNNDDGESSHSRGRVRIMSGLAEHNGGSAVAPALGCDAIYYDFISNKNQQIENRKYSAFAVIGDPSDGGNYTFAYFVRCESYGDRVSFKDNAPITATRAVCVSCHSHNPLIAAYDVYKIADCTHTGTGTPKTSKVLVENRGDVLVI